MYSQKQALSSEKSYSGSPLRLMFDGAQMLDNFDVTPFTIKHTLSNHPLLQLPQLIELSKSLPPESVEYNAGDLPIGQDPSLTPRTGLSIEETLRQIEKCRSWMVLKNVEQDAHYRQLLDECLDQVQPAIEAVCPGMTGRKAFVFVSSPGAVTPFHVDFEYNFLMQIRGEKFMTVFDDQDRSLLSELQREQAVQGAPRNLVYKDEFAAKSRTFHLKPGIGLHVPLTAPHWVKVADEASVSFSITFHSRASERRMGAHRANAMLRKVGISPRQVGVSPQLDALKYSAFRVTRKLSTITAQALGAVRAKGPT
jgi:hypothetical protein